jgi:hypothetical protein
MSLCADRLKGDPIMVKTTRLSSYITGPVDLLKMDIEGAEPEVLDELNESGALVHVKALFLEYHHHIDSRLDSLSVILDILERNNFGYLIRGGFRSPPRTGEFQDLCLRQVVVLNPSPRCSCRRPTAAEFESYRGWPRRSFRVTR